MTAAALSDKADDFHPQSDSQSDFKENEGDNFTVTEKRESDLGH